ncbi:TIGR02300 family protein [Leptospira weilii]|uniref:TIGR02300 family protein n=1 Tax=Leptospira weilii TaxID=28184 RepID=UPI000773DA13|nr:TIGR02300 family protein [Leptospira weilii]
MANSKKTKPKKTATAVAKKKAAVKKVAPKKGNASAKKKVEIIKKALSNPSLKSKSTIKPTGTKKVSGSKGVSLNPLGKKWTCHTCSTKFYDLNKEEKICPKCGADQNKRPVTRTRTVRPRVVEEEEIIDDEALVDEEMEFTEEPLEEALDEDGDDAEEPEE